MENFILALQTKKGFDFLSNFRTCGELSSDDLRNIIKEIVYAIENADILESDRQALINIIVDNLSDYI